MIAKVCIWNDLINANICINTYQLRAEIIYIDRGIVESRAPKDIPGPFAKALFWPEEVKRKKPQPKRTETVPSVATSDEWQTYHQSKQEKKQAELQKKEERLRRRLEAREKKKIQQEKRKQLQEEKKRILAQKKLQIDAIKRELAEKRQCQKKTGAKQKKQRVTEQWAIIIH